MCNGCFGAPEFGIFQSLYGSRGLSTASLGTKTGHQAGGSWIAGGFSSENVGVTHQLGAAAEVSSASAIVAVKLTATSIRNAYLLDMYIYLGCSTNTYLHLFDISNEFRQIKSETMIVSTRGLKRARPQNPR